MAELNVKARSIKDKEGAAVLRRLWELGFDKVAWNHTIFGKPTQANLSNLPKISQSLPQSDANASLPFRALSGCNSNTIEQFQRLTIIVDDMAEAQSLHSSNDALKSFDILAATPSNAKVFGYLCRDSDIDIISIDFTRHLPFSITKKTIDEAVKRGIYFEIRVGPTLFNAGHRRETISNVKHLIRVLRGRNIVLTSGMDSSSQLRGPYDMINIGKALHLSEAQSRGAIYEASQRILQHAASRRRRYYPVALTTYQKLLETLNDHDSLYASSDRTPAASSSSKKRSREVAADEDDDETGDEEENNKRSRVNQPTDDIDDGLLLFE